MFASLLRGALLCAFAPVALASGQLDPSFDGDGILLTNVSSFDQLKDGLIDSAGRYVGAGFAPSLQTTGGLLLRLQPNGARDSGFGSNGVVRLPKVDPFTIIVWEAVVEQPDGKLIVAGRAGDLLVNNNSPSRAYLCRVLASGTPDPQFGSGGCVSPTLHPDSSRDYLSAMALQADGRVVLVGVTDSLNDGIADDYFVARLNSDGSRDLCFGDVTCQIGGILIDPEPLGFFPNAVAVAQDGRIVIAGVGSFSPDAEMTVVRLQPTGEVDIGFGDGGHRFVAFDQGGGDYDAAYGLVVRSDNSIVIAGEVSNTFGDLVGVAALDALGAPINGFGTQGKQILFFNDVASDNRATKLVQQSDGKLVLSGYTDSDANSENYEDCGVARLTSDGQPDAEFGFNGVNSFDGGLGLQEPHPELCFSLDTDGRHIVLFGMRQPDGNGFTDALLIRLDQDALFGDGFE